MRLVPQALLLFCIMVQAEMLCVSNSASAQDAPQPDPQLEESFLKKWFKDPLLKPPFSKAPADDVKGLAAQIRKNELDAEYRIDAIRYLGTVDCVAFPKARALLIKSMQEDPIEPVRYEAVMALSLMLSRGAKNDICTCRRCCEEDPASACVADAEKYSRKKARRVYGKNVDEDQRYDYCHGCCDAETLQALAEVAYGRRDDGCWVEPSLRVREAAECALKICPCHPYVKTVPIPETFDKGREKEGTIEDKQKQEGESNDKPNEPAPLPGVDETGASLSLTSTSALHGRFAYNVPIATTVDEYNELYKDKPVAVLSNHCLVGLKNHQFLKVDGTYSASYKGRIYYFSDSFAKQQFEANPGEYAPAWCGLDPVAYVQRGEFVEGKFLREYDGRFYLFASKDSWEQFKTSPSRYIKQSD